MAFSGHDYYEEDSEDEVSCDSSSEPEIQPDSPRDVHNTPCKFYNRGNCKDGSHCRYLHVCEYYFKGNCKHGIKCKYSHSEDGDDSESQSQEPRDKPYQWQIRSGSKWYDVEMDWIIEAQYSLPNVKGIKLYNTKFGMICINFNAMRVQGKQLGVRRQTFPNSSQKTAWLWYFRGDTKWQILGKQDPQDSSLSFTNADIEREYQRNKHGLFQFSVGTQSYHISFQEMNQINISSKSERRVRRRPVFVVSKHGGSLSTSLSSKRWQYSDSKGSWHDFKHMSCSVQSKDIEDEYQRNPNGKMKFTIGSTFLELDFSAMTQMNLSTGRVRVLRRI